jgi:hypothetical protein
MANWAIVIGIDRYWTEQASLKGAVRDALRVRDWLVDVSGGAVPPRNLLLVLGPSAASRVPTGLSYEPATKDRIIEVADMLMRKSDGQGDRFFFHFSGHGLTTRIGGNAVNALAAANFSDLLTENSLSLPSIFAYFKAARFREQFFFIDACRNIPWAGREYDVGKMPPRSADPRFGEPAQFYLFATSDGLKAVELREAGHERGAFTDELLNGLKGQGSAKVYCPEVGRYEVSISNLSRYVKKQVSDRRLEVLKSDKLAGGLIQEPQGYGNLDGNPVLGTFEPTEFPNETLELFIDPASAVSATNLTIRDEEDYVEERSAIQTLPVSVPLPPRRYTIRARAAGYEPEKTRWWVDLYGPYRETVRLKRSGFGEKSVRSASDASEATRSFSTRPNAADVAALDAECSDPLATLELVDASGAVIARAQGKLVRTDLKPGLYRLRLRTPEGPASERLIDLDAGDSEPVQIEAPPLPLTGLVPTLVRGIGGTIDRDNTVEVSEDVGPMAAPSLSTLLSLAGTAANEDTQQSGRLHRLGLAAFRHVAPAGTSSGLQVLVGVDAETAAEVATYLAGFQFRAWALHDPVPEAVARPAPLPQISGLAALGVAREPGSCWVSFEAPGQRPVVCAIAILPGRLTLLVVQRDRGGQLRIFQYQPGLDSDLKLRDEVDISFDPNASRRRNALYYLRQIDLLQRFYQGGQLAVSQSIAWRLLHAKWVEPIAGCLGSYLMLRLGKPRSLHVAANNLTGHFDTLSDSHLIKGESLAADDNAPDVVRAAFVAALDRGLPVCADGLPRLASAVATYGIDHPNVRLLEAVQASQVPGLLWSAWAPPAFVPGRPVGVQ